MSDEKEGHALLAKGRLLFDSCSTENDYACVIGYLNYNRSQGGWRAEAITEFIAWLQHQCDTQTQHGEKAVVILQRLDKARSTNGCGL